ncbi:hypothetical protein HZY86_01775 [Aerococcaceae bacterium DSM 111020]|nr:hypothetical protein [Aerococcaceae bacterium DSM 111020]
MMTISILFVRSNQAYLPEIEAYVTYFNKLPQYRAVDSQTLTEETIDYADYDVIWEFKGFGGVKRKDLAPHQMLIHEYLSLSTGQMPRIKDRLKKMMNPKPDLRIFLNTYIQEQMHFTDGIPYHYRDMGVSEGFLNQSLAPQRSGYVYVGVVSDERQITTLLEYFKDYPDEDLYLIGDADEAIQTRYQDFSHLHFLGRQPYQEIPKLLSQYQYGINFIPDEFPFNKQTSTKLLEYVALGLDILSTDYEWVRDFEAAQGANFYYFDDQAPAIDFDAVKTHSFRGIDEPSALAWDKIIAESGIVEAIDAFMQAR